MKPPRDRPGPAEAFDLAGTHGSSQPKGTNMVEQPAFGSRWWVVFGATLSMLVAQGPVILYTLGLFIKPLSQDFGWDRASISAAGGLAAISSAIAIPLVGWLIDRWGIRPILLPIVVLFSVEYRSDCLDARFDHRVHAFLRDHRFPRIGPRTARLREFLPGSTTSAVWPWA
jgi:hypothetical protein